LFEYPFQPAPRYGWGRPPHQGILAELAAGVSRYEGVVDSFFRYEEDFARIPGGRSVDGRLTWLNDYWGGLDAMALYSFISERRPATYLEVGSGFSTMFARRAIEDHGLDTKIVSIDPHPRAGIDGLTDRSIRTPLESIDLNVFSELTAGDIFVLDGSHCTFMNSDTVVAFLDILPKIPSGVLVCVDDIFLPWDYPPGWTNRWYGEQYLLAALLMGGGLGWSPVFPAWYVTQESPVKAKLDPLWAYVMPTEGKHAKSFWMERTAV
jgi:hypothetical protein